MMKQNVRTMEEVAGVIKSVLVAQKRSITMGMSIVELNNEYKEQDGINIPFRALGYPSLLDFLESLQKNDEIVIRKRGTMHVVYPRVNEKIAHVSALVSRQRNASKKHSGGGRTLMARSYPRSLYHPPRLDSKLLADVVKLVKTAPKGMHISTIIEYLKDRNTCNVDKHHLIRQLADVNHEVAVEDNMIYPRKQCTWRPIAPSGNANSTNRYAVENKPAAALRPAGISDSDDDDTSKFLRAAKTNESAPLSLPKTSYQRNRVREESKAVVPCTDENANACRREDENCHVADEEDIGMLVSDRTKFRLEKLIQKYPAGIWCAELPTFYREEYSIPLNYEELGFGSVSDFAAHLPGIFHCVRLQEKGDFKLFDAKAPKPEERQSERPGHLSLAALHNVYQNYCDEMEAVPATLSSSTSQRLVPDGVMTIGETVAQIFVTELFPDKSTCIDVVVVDVITPSFFWIQLLKRIPRFRQFMTELHDFYTLNASKYVIPIVVLERGLNCACIFDTKWHRGVIKAVKPDSTVTVMLYDYGTVASYPPQDIHFLHRSFSSLPAQAIPCGLFNVKPKSTVKWPHIICQAFVETVLDVPLVAMSGSIDADNNSMLIALTNTEGNQDLHINDWMVSSGYAMYGKMVCIRPPNYPFRRFLECAYDSTTDTCKNTSTSAKIVRLPVNVDAPEASALVSMETDGNLLFYDTLLKLHRKSGKNSLKASSSSSIDSGSRREESRVLNTVTSRTDKITVSHADTHNVMTISNGYKPSSLHGKNFSTNLLSKLCEARATRIAPMNNSSSDNGSGGHKSSSVSVKSSASSSLASTALPDGKRISVEPNCINETPQNPKTSLAPKRNANLLKLIALSTSTKSNITSGSVISPDGTFRGDEGILAKPTFATLPLHLKSEMPERRNGASEFGAIYSTHGGHGRVEPIDSDEVGNGGRSAGNASDTSRGKPVQRTALTPPERGSPRNSSTFTIFRNSMEKNSPNSHFVNSKAPMKTSLRLREAMPKPEEESSAELHQETPKPKENASIKRQEMPKPDPVAPPIISTAIPSVSLSVNGSPKFLQAKKTFLNLVKKSKEKQQTLPEFGDFHSKFGGNGRMESIAWNEFRKVVDSPEKSEESLKASPEDASKPGKKTFVDLPPARKGFLNVVNSGRPPTNERESMCVPEGNIKRQSDVSPTLRMIVKSANEERGDKQLRLYIPNDVTELLRDDGKTDDSTSVKSHSSSSTASERNKSLVVDPREMLVGSRIKGAVKYQSFGRAGAAVERNASDSLPATTESESPPANDTSANGIKSTEEMLKSTDSSVIASCESPVSSKSIEIPEKVVSLKSGASRGKIGRENAGKRVDSAVGELSRSSFESLVTSGESRSIRSTNDDLEAGGSIANAGTSTKESLIAKTKEADDTKDSVGDGLAKSSSPTVDKTTSAWLQSVFFKPKSTLLTGFFKFIKACPDSADGSELDSDDLSFEDDTNKEDSPRMESSAIEVKKSSSCHDFDSSMEELDAALPFNEELRVLEEKAKVSLVDEDNEKTTHSRDFGKTEKSVCPSKNTDASSLQLAKNIPEYIPCFDDTCVGSDTDEWDFSPGHSLHSCIGDQLQLNNVGLSETIDGTSGLARPVNMLTKQDSSSDEEIVEDSSKDKQKVVLSAANGSFKDLGSSAQQNTTADGTSNLQRSSRLHDYSTDQNRPVDCDKRPNSTDGPLKDNPDDANKNNSLKLPTQSSYSILSDVHAFNISATADALENISSSGSSSSVGKSNDESYAKSLITAFKQYL